MVERTRVKCPLCNMVTDLDRLADLNTPIELKVFLQTFGGSPPGQRGGKMSYDELTDDESINNAKEIILARLKRAIEVLE